MIADTFHLDSKKEDLAKEEADAPAASGGIAPGSSLFVRSRLDLRQAAILVNSGLNFAATPEGRDYWIDVYRRLYRYSVS